MAICRLMCLDFMEGTGRYEENGDARYSDSNLDEGAAYADWLLSDGYKTEPFYGFDLIAFRSWCVEELRRAA